ncbi:MAG: hypothetical protein AAFN79_10050 [Pseudomonadota bacterium]
MSNRLSQIERLSATAVALCLAACAPLNDTEASKGSEEAEYSLKVGAASALSDDAKYVTAPVIGLHRDGGEVRYLCILFLGDEPNPGGCTRADNSVFAPLDVVNARYEDASMAVADVVLSKGQTSDQDAVFVGQIEYALP